MPSVLTTTRIVRRSLDVVLVLLVAFVLATLVVARVIPVLTGGATFVVGGGSMEPAIPIGSVVIVTPAPAGELAVGDIVSVKVGARQAVFTHRITRLVPREDGLWLETKGDANARPDPSIIPATTVIGREAASVPYAGYAVRLLGTVQGVLLLLGLGVLVLAGAWLLETIEIDHVAARRRAAGAMHALAPDIHAMSAEHSAREGAAG